MTWKPEPRLIIGGVDFSSQTLRGARVTYGRDEYLGQNRAPYASFVIETESNPEFGGPWIAEPVQLDVKDTSGAYVRQFTGKVSDFSLQVIGSGDQVRLRLSIQAVGTTGDVIAANTQATTPDPSLASGTPLRALDWVVIREILLDGLAPVINSLPGTVNDLPGTINDMRGALGVINTATGPSQNVEIEYPVAEARNAWEFAGEIASESGGQIWESRDGLINYSSIWWAGLSSHTLPASLISTADLTMSVGTSETYTRIYFDQPPSLSNPSGTPDTVGWVGDIWLYGDRELNYPERIYTASAEAALVSQLTGDLGRYQLKLDGLAVDLRIPAAEPYVDQLLELAHLDAISITGLPDLMPLYYGLSGRVFGWELELGQQTAVLNIKINRLDY